MKYEELEPRELEVSGEIPSYCCGVLFRNGLGPLSLQTDKENKVYRTNHWFDCLSQVHRFQIHAPSANDPKIRVTHNSRRTCDGVIERIMRTGDRSEFTFAAKYEPCKTFFQKLQGLFIPSNTNEKPDAVSVSVTLSPNFPAFSRTGKKKQGPHDASCVESLINKTDHSMVQALDPETLEPLGIARQSVLHPDLKGALSAAHAKVCSKTGDWYNFNLDFRRTGCYRVFHVSAATGKVDILAAIEAKAAYLHSSLLTENYYVLCVWNSHFSAGGASVLWHRNVCDAISDFDPSKPAMWYVVERKPRSEGGRGLVATYESDPFFCFHTINAYEEPSPTDPGHIDMVADVCAYDGLDVLKRFYIDNVRSDSSSAKAYSHPKYRNARPYYRRFRLPNVAGLGSSSAARAQKAVNVSKGSKDIGLELPSINHSFSGRNYRYIYGVMDTGKSTFLDGLVKYDIRTNAPSAVWSIHGQTAGEPIFIADPKAGPDEEDRGVLLSVVLDGLAEKSYLLVLDAQNLHELARATMTGDQGNFVGFGFHGAHVRETREAVEDS